MFSLWKNIKLYSNEASVKALKFDIEKQGGETKFFNERSNRREIQVNLYGQKIFYSTEWLVI